MSESDDPEYRNGDGAIKMRLKKTDCEDVNWIKWLSGQYTMANVGISGVDTSGPITTKLVDREHRMSNT
jgi:hypothetical protein